MEKENLYSFHSREKFLIERYGFDRLPLKVINDCYRLAVDIVLCEYGVELLSDLPYGMGYMKTRNHFIELLTQAKELIKG